MESIVVTGGTGFIGSRIVEKFKNLPYKIYVITRQELADAANVCYIKGDIGDYDFVAQLMKNYKPQILFHLAWEVQAQDYTSSAVNKKYYSYSVNLLDEFLKNGGKEVIASGTCFEYDLTGDKVLTPDSKCNPATEYGKAKLATYQKFSKKCAEARARLVWARFFYLIGGGKIDRKFTTYVLKCVMNGTVVSCKTPENVVDYIDVRDVAILWQQAFLDKNIEGIINIGSAKGYKISEIIALIEGMVGKKAKTDYGNGYTVTKIVSDDSLLRELNYSCRYSLKDSIEDVYKNLKG